MTMKNILSIILVFVFFSTTANAGFLGLEHGWPRLVDDETTIKNKYIGSISYFEAKNRFYERNVHRNEHAVGRGAGNSLSGMEPYFKQLNDIPQVYIGNPTFLTWADMSMGSEGLEVVDGAFEVTGQLELEGIIHDGVAFSASLVDVAWDAYTIAFKMGTDQSGYLCDLGFCSFANELLTFDLVSGTFDGDFSKSFVMSAQTVATVPLPAAVWLFSVALLGLGWTKRSL